jgi:hypothetical protein
MLFLVYINDIFDLKISGKIISYADDTAIVFNSNCVNNLVDMAEKDMQNVYKWLNDNLLTSNLNKTIFMPFSC